MRPASSHVRLSRLSQAEGFIEAMRALLQRLQIEAQRAAASPAERLLDDALQILAGSAQMDYQARKQVCSGLNYFPVPCWCLSLHGARHEHEMQTTRCNDR